MNPKVTVRERIFAIGRVLLFCLSCATILALTSGLMKGMPVRAGTFIIGACATLGAFILTLLFAKWEKVKPKDLGVVPNKNSASRMAAGFIIGSVLATLQPLMVIIISGHVKLSLTDGVTVLPVISSLLLFLLLACREELSFRGYPLRTINRFLGPWVAQVIIALIFAAEHAAGGMPWWQALLGTGVGSLLFEIAALATKGLALPIGIHAAWNFGQWVLGFKDTPGVWHTIIEKGYQQQTEKTEMIWYLVVMIIAIMAFYFYKQKCEIKLTE